jgi:hypothetical protein
VGSHTVGGVGVHRKAPTPSDIFTHTHTHRPARTHLVELGVRTASQEAVELHQEAQVRVLRLGGRTVTLLLVLAHKINAHGGGLKRGQRGWREWEWK